MYVGILLLLYFLTGQSKIVCFLRHICIFMMYVCMYVCMYVLGSVVALPILIWPLFQDGGIKNPPFVFQQLTLTASLYPKQWFGHFQPPNTSNVL